MAKSPVNVEAAYDINNTMHETFPQSHDSTVSPKENEWKTHT